MTAPLIHVEGLNRTYRSWHRGSGLKDLASSLFHRRFTEVRALDGLGFDIAPGELVGFLGPNGAGKSTTIKILSGVLYPTGGTVTVGGLVPWKDRQRYVQGIGAVFGQKSQLVWDIPPQDSFLMNRAIYGIPREEFDATLGHLATLLGVEQVMTKPTRNLSLGERMKCEFIMAMPHRPAIVFLDEPTIGLDVIAKETIRHFILEMNRQGTTFILTTHDLADIEFLARRVIVINHGRLVFDDSLDRLRGLFGDRRRIRMVADRPIPALDLPGLTEVGREPGGERGWEVRWELDLGTHSLDDFLQAVGKGLRIVDLEVTAVPIEAVIKTIYLQTQKE